MIDIQIVPGDKFEGDEVVLVNGDALLMREQGRLAWLISRNEQRRRVMDPTVAHWKRDSREYLASFFTACVYAESEEALAQVFRGFKV